MSVEVDGLRTVGEMVCGDSSGIGFSRDKFVEEETVRGKGARGIPQRRIH